MRRTPFVHAVLLCTTFFAACAEPPLKEMNQAQGAIDAARAAGAEQFATTEFRSATDALQQSEQAVTQKDYRLALGLAIDARERAQQAAKAAVDARTNARGEAERAVVEAGMRLTQARERLANPDLARLPRRSLDPVTQILAAAEETMQEARTALSGDDYTTARQRSADASARIEEAAAALETVIAGANTRKRR